MTNGIRIINCLLPVETDLQENRLMNINRDDPVLQTMFEGLHDNSDP